MSSEKTPAFQLSKSIEYVSQSVVSKTIIKKPGGNITLFAFDKEQGLEEHTTHYEAMVYVLDGEVEITIAGNTNRVSQGYCIVLPANVPHSLKANEKFKMMLTMIKS